MADAILKRCNRCGEHKSVDEFSTGHGRCRPCLLAVRREKYAQDAQYRESIKAKNKQWARSNKERKSSVDKAWRQANKERVYENQRKWKLANWDRYLSMQLRSRHRNIDAYRAREAAYREQNRAACNERIRQWKAKNPDATVFYFHKRRAAQIQALPAWANFDAMSAIYKTAQELGPDYHVDHVVPLLGKTVCGLHCEANLQIISATENMKKNNRWWPDMWEDV